MHETERQLTSEDRRRKLVERHIEEYDIPDSLKRQKYEEHPSGASRVAQLVLSEIFNPGQGEWLDQHALSGVSALTGKVVRAGRVHTQPRTTFYECGSHKKANRLSVMFSAQGKCQLVDEDASRRGAETKSLPTFWVGATFFYHDRPLGDETHEVYVDTLD